MTKSVKHCGKRRNCSFWAISSFVTMFSKSLTLSVCCVACTTVIDGMLCGTYDWHWRYAVWQVRLILTVCCVACTTDIIGMLCGMYDWPWRYAVWHVRLSLTVCCVACTTDIDGMLFGMYDWHWRYAVWHIQLTLTVCCQFFFTLYNRGRLTTPSPRKLSIVFPLKI